MALDTRKTRPMCGETVEAVATRCFACGETCSPVPRTYVGKAYTPQRAYRTSVLPFAALLLLNGVVILAVCSVFPLLPIAYFPLVCDPAGQRIGMGILAVTHIVFGIGFLRRSRLLWRTFFGYLGIATCLAAVAQIVDRPKFLDSRDAVITAAFVCVANTLVAVGLYFATRPAFAAASENRTS